MSNFPPTIYIEVYKTDPPRLRGFKRNQPWRIRIVNASNHRILASSESYTNESDALLAAHQIGSDVTMVYLRRADHVDELLRESATGPTG